MSPRAKNAGDPSGHPSPPERGTGEESPPFRPAPIRAARVIRRFHFRTAHELSGPYSSSGRQSAESAIHEFFSHAVHGGLGMKTRWGESKSFKSASASAQPEPQARACGTSARGAEATSPFVPACQWGRRGGRPVSMFRRRQDQLQGRSNIPRTPSIRSALYTNPFRSRRGIRSCRERRWRCSPAKFPGAIRSPWRSDFVHFDKSVRMGSIHVRDRESTRAAFGRRPVHQSISGKDLACSEFACRSAVFRCSALFLLPVVPISRPATARRISTARIIPRRAGPSPERSKPIPSPSRRA